MERLCRMSATVPRLCHQGGRAWFVYRVEDAPSNLRYTIFSPLAH